MIEKTANNTGLQRPNGATEPYTPKHLHLWTSYFGSDWSDYYVFLGRRRDSDALERANFDAAFAAIGGEQVWDVIAVTEQHWAVGWIAWIAIHRDAEKALRAADKIAERLLVYPVVSAELRLQYECDEAYEAWARCYSASERVDYIRRHRSQFDFRDFADMLRCVRGLYFVGNARELIAQTILGGQQ